MRSKPRVLARARRAVAVLLGVGTAFVLSAAPASADLNDCASGQGCLWANNSYTSAYYRTYDKVDNYDNKNWEIPSRTNVGNNASSSAGYGNTCNASFYANTYQSGHNFNYYRPSIGGVIRDPNHSNGAGWGPYAGENWDNRISSLRWYCG